MEAIIITAIICVTILLIVWLCNKNPSCTRVIIKKIDLLEHVKDQAIRKHDNVNLTVYSDNTMELEYYDESRDDGPY